MVNGFAGVSPEPKVTVPDYGMNQYQQFIHLSRYARWREEDNRRETWEETVTRYVDFFREHNPEVPEDTFAKLQDFILTQKVMPSMRALMTAGKALERENLAAFNCAFIAVNHPRVFDEILYILLNGCGNGFSVETSSVTQLPTVAENFHKTDTCIVVADSKLGWANSYRELISLLYTGLIPTWDMSKVRPAGSRLKTFGGRASGPEPLKRLFEFTIATFVRAAGRKLTSLEVHDIVCKIADIVVVGGVRRCLPGDAPVFTPAGPKSIKDIVVGDTVVTGGKTAKVVAAECSGNKETLIISHRFGKLECTPEHRVAVFNSIMKYEFKEAKDISPGDRLVWDSLGYEGTETQLPPLDANFSGSRKELTQPSLSEDIAWLLGLFQGDGWVGERSIEISGNSKELATLERASKIFTDNFNVECSVGSDGKAGNGIRLRLNSVALANWFKLFIKQANTPITIPTFITNAKRPIRFAYLAGLMDADGRIRIKDNRIDLATTVYESFSQELITLLAGLGIAARAFFGSAQKRRNRGENAQDFWTVSISGATNRKMFYTGCKEASQKLQDRELHFEGLVDFSFPIRWAGSNKGYSPDGNISVLKMRYDLPLLPTRVLSVTPGRSVETFDIEVEDLEQFTTNGIVVHNSALISLSDLSDDRMRTAKTGQWWETNVQRALANNSAAYTDKPTIDTFMTEWLALYQSKSGERGIFNRNSVKKYAAKYGRRDPDHAFGTNPCVTGDTWVLTSDGPRQITDLTENPFVAIVNGREYPATNFWKSGVKPVFEITTKHGMAVKATENHKFVVETLEGLKKVEVKDLKIGDKLIIGNNRSMDTWDGEYNSFEQGWLLGEIVGDGGFNPEKYRTYVRFWGENAQSLAALARNILTTVPGSSPGHVSGTASGIETVSSKALDTLASVFLEPKTKALMPALEKNTSSEFQAGFLRGFFDADGTVFGDPKGKGITVRLAQSDVPKLKVVQRMLAAQGIVSKLITKRAPAGYKSLPDGKGGHKDYFCKELNELLIGRDNLDIFYHKIGFSDPSKQQKLETLLASRSKTPYREMFSSIITSIVPAGTEMTYDCTVEDAHAFTANSLVISNCGEIGLRDSGGLCNLTEVVIRPEDTLETLKEKIEVATILGTLQSTLTNFKYVRSIWKKNAEEERLLGVSLTGIVDNELTSGKLGKQALADALDTLREHSVAINKHWADFLGIQPSAAITTVKPSGTVSALVDSGSGIHPRYAPYFIRTVRGDMKDPLSQFLYMSGVPCEPDVTKPNDIWVFSFPMKSPENAIFKNDLSAIEQLEMYKMYRTHYTEHNVSVTVYIKSHEWLDVAAWVYRNFDDICGVSFLPSEETGHTYEQAPYQEITKEQYETLSAAMPVIDWSKLPEYEKYDTTTGTQELACTAGGCEIVTTS